MLCTFSKINCVIRLFSKFYSKMRGTPEEPDQNNGQDDLQSRGTYLKQFKEINQNWEKIFDICFCVFCNHYYHLHFWKWDMVLGSLSTQVWNFSNIFLFPKMLWQIMRHLVYNVFYAKCQAPFLTTRMTITLEKLLTSILTIGSPVC